MKQFKLKTDSLQQIVKLLQLAAQSNAVLPIIEYVLIKTDPGRAQFIMTNLETTITFTQLEIDCDKKGELLIRFTELKKILAVAISEDVTISFDEKTGKVDITCGDDQFKLGSQDKIVDFPKLPEVPTDQQLEVNDGLLKSIGLAAKTTINDMNKPACGYVCLDLKKDGTTVVSTDTNAMYARTFKAYTVKTPEQVMIPPKIAAEAGGWLKAFIRWNNTHISITSVLGATITLTRTTHKFPNYAAVIPSDYGEPMTTSRAAMLRALDVSAVVSKQVSIELEKQRVKADDLDFDQHVLSQLPLTYAGKYPEIKFTLDNLYRLLHQVDGDNLQFNIITPYKAVVIKCDAEPDTTLLIMPVFINN